MNRQKILVSATVLVALFSLVYWIWSGWGLITVDVKGKPLAEVIRSIEKQGGIVLKTNMDLTKPVTMSVHKRPLTDALEALAGSTESRWRLGYFFGPDAATLKGAYESIARGKRPEGWKSFEVPLMGETAFAGERGAPPDPRRDQWNVKAPAEKTLQGFMQAAAAGVSASFTCPETFNPVVAKVPSSGQIRKLAPQVAKAAGAKWEEVFLLMGRPPAPPGSQVADAGRDDDDFGFSGFGGGGGPPRGRGGSGDGRRPDFTLMRERQLAEIAKLPAGEQAAAKEEFEEREKFFASLKDLTDDERRAKFAEMANSPANQDRMADRQIKGSERRSPEQRVAKYQNYVATKQAATSAKNAK